MFLINITFVLSFQVTTHTFPSRNSLGKEGHCVIFHVYILGIIEGSNKTIAIPFGGTKYGRLVFLIIKFTNTIYKQTMECVMNKVSVLGTINLKKINL
jgi:hypothetical protein